MSFYTSDSPCRRCNGTLRHKTGSHKGQCASCISNTDAEKKARSFILDAREIVRPDDEDAIELPFTLEGEE